MYVRFAREPRALLFDAGDIHALSPAEVLKISDIFVTHMHIDHFFGFDVIIRTLLSREQSVNVYGPEGITSCVEGKLHGYAWNLIVEYPLRIIVHEVTAADTLRSTEFAAHRHWEPRLLDQRPMTGGVLLEESNFLVRTAILSHDIPCLAFCLEEPAHININKDALDALDLPPGPWLTELKRVILAEVSESIAPTEEICAETPSENCSDMLIPTSRGLMHLDELRHIAIISEGQRISYVMDSAPTEENLARIADLVRGSSVLYCETFFAQEDHDRAEHRHHLTGRMAGTLARDAGVKILIPMHFSTRYKSRDTAPDVEALDAFNAH